MQAGRETTFRRCLVGITVGGIAVRVGLAFWYQDHAAVAGDGLTYLSLARLIGRGVGWVEPVQYLGLHHRVPTAVHPPLYPLFLSAIDFAGVHGTLAHRLWSCMPGAVTVPVIGVVTKSLAGRRAGLIAAAYAAVSISLAVQDVVLWSEGLYVMMTVLTVWCAYRAIARPTVRNIVFLAAAIAASALTRAEAVLLIALLLVPIIVRAGAGAHRTRLAVVACTTIVVIFVPWVTYNATRFERPVVISTGLGPVLWSSNCNHTYYGPNTGGWYFICSKHRFASDESKADGQQVDVALHYIDQHTDRLPAVISARLARTFGIWHPAGLVRRDLFLDDADLGWAGSLIAVQFAVSAVVGAYGLLALRRRGRAVLPILAPVATVVIMTVVGYGSFRFRAAVDAVIPIVVAVGSVAAWDRWTSRTGAPSGNVVATSR